MRILIVAAACLALAVPGLAAAETWLPIARGQAHASYADPDATTGQGAVVKVREMKVYDPPVSVEGVAVRARLVDYQFDCPTKRFRILRVENLDEAGKTLSVSPVTEDYRDPVVSGTVGERLDAFGCDNAYLDPMAARTRAEAINDGRALLAQR